MTAAHAPMTVLLAATDPALLASLRQRRPDVQALAIGSRIPDERIDGPLWCFVDWLLPDISGLEMCRRLRDAESTRDSHITMVLEEADPEARRRALRAGADDYLIGPLDLPKLAERLALYQSAPPRAPVLPRLTHGELSVDLAAHQARYRGVPAPLRPNEFNLLAWFLAHPDQVFSRTSLIGQIGKDAGAIDERTVDVWVGRLRRALAAHGVPDPLRTVRSLGYVLDSLPG
ncbi:MAG TPA: winged helix-turn-helix domain-containing protein [Novosphingobium sp.]|nr:winged helix-turn-helix domain-containing protein [Novosphingobium sp.]